MPNYNNSYDFYCAINQKINKEYFIVKLIFFILLSFIYKIYNDFELKVDMYILYIVNYKSKLISK
ncbi:MAG: hypothetical protein K0Q97_1574 [Bacillota bacterium]|nr:hypothetical protein [Bacillota bacterium]